MGRRNIAFCFIFLVIAGDFQQFLTAIIDSSNSENPSIETYSEAVMELYDPSPCPRPFYPSGNTVHLLIKLAKKLFDSNNKVYREKRGTGIDRQGYGGYGGGGGCGGGCGSGCCTSSPAAQPFDPTSLLALLLSILLPLLLLLYIISQNNNNNTTAGRRRSLQNSITCDLDG